MPKTTSSRWVSVAGRRRGKTTATPSTSSLEDPVLGVFYVKGDMEIELIDRNNFEAQGPGRMLLLGRDPFDPDATITLGPGATFVGRRFVVD